LKQKSIEKIEMFYERWLKLANSLQTPTMAVLDHSIPIQTIILLAHWYYMNEAGDFITTQGFCADMWRRYFCA